ncbi:hypothetical protein [Erythrobacter aureus]|uniref:Uncharacterized protein n=1 Tax=Erythrobacter aureus TaxID=2182384 RepID=A0A345YIN4_9SPHN|nr:hypothetical protein [Erythrobacter aureus]AXK43786.1 hypothetical protein DVR09_15125 [Erythrobacter aureus]
MTVAAVQSEPAVDWFRQPTALEVAHYNSILKRKADDASLRARRIFGDCLHKLTQLGMKEAQARSMLGKWRGQAKDDDLLIRTVEKAHEISSPDPVSYVTKALKEAKSRTSKTKALQKSEWTLLGWEAPTQTPAGPKYKKGERGQVWRDPFGKEVILPAKSGTALPSHEEEPGYTLDRKSKAA